MGILFVDTWVIWKGRLTCKRLVHYYYTVDSIPFIILLVNKAF